MKINVISFNIRCCDDANGHSIAERGPRLAAITSKYSPDIIGLQEYTPAWETYIEKYYGDAYAMFIKYRNETIDVEATPILWRKDKFDCVKTGYFWLSDTPEMESRGWDEKYNCYRMCTYTILRAKQTNQSFTVMNTHFGFGNKGQIASTELIYSYRKKIADLQTLVIGDFNMKPNSLGYEAMTKNFIDVNACTAKDLSTTYHNYQPETLTTEHIDYCFIDKTIMPINQKIITDTIDGKFPSDHYGLYIELNI